MKRALSFSLFLLLTLASHAHAGQPRTHDGFFMRLAGGVAVANTSTERKDGDELEFGDIGGDGHFAMGGTVVPNLILHGTIWGWWLKDADGELTGQNLDNYSNVNMIATGGGLTYYFDPSNIYISGSLGWTHIDIEREFSNPESPFFGEPKSGLSFTALVGKEWWVGNSWGLGLAGEINFHSLPNYHDELEGWSGISFGLLVSATLN